MSKELIEKLRNKAYVTELGDQQSAGSDEEAMRLAADAIERLELEAVAATVRIENDKVLIEGSNSGWYDRLLESELTCRELLESRDAYQQAADTMAAAHKVDRDGLLHEVDATQLAFEHWRDESIELRAELEKIKEQEPVAWVEVIDRHEGPYNFNGEKLLDSGKHSLYLAPGAQPAPEGKS